MDYLDAHKIRVFNLHEAAIILDKAEKYVSMRLSKMPKIRRATKGVYYVRGTDVGEIATGIVSPSYISLLSAFRYREATTQIPLEIQVIAPIQHRTMIIEGNRIRFIRLHRERIFGYSRLENSIVASLEKAIIDSLYLNLYADEAIEVFQDNLSLIDIGKLIDYGIRMKSRATTSRLGFMIEMLGESAESLLPVRSERYVKFGQEGDKRNKKWRVIHAY